MGIVKCSVPINVQFEVTYRCNNNCVFCYNPDALKNETELNTQEAILIIRDLASCGVLSVNFNGGEPLKRNDFFQIVDEADRVGLDIHMNTNASLIDSLTAQMVARYFPSVCATVLSGNSQTHDLLSGRRGAFEEAMLGIQKLQKQSVYVAVNIMLSRVNLEEMKDIISFLRSCGIRSVLVTRYVPCESVNDDLHISDEEFLSAIADLYAYNDRHNCFDRIAFPQPFKLCNAPEGLRSRIAESNVACNIGLCTASISPNGDLSPCNLVKNPVLGNLKEESFLTLWSKFKGDEFCEKEHLTKKCKVCADLASCGGGCKGYNDALRKGNISWKHINI